MLLTSLMLTVTVSLTWYDPALGGINCDHECEFTGAGYRVAEWYDRGLACPEEFPIGTIFVIEGSRWGLADGEWVCIDRGGSVVIEDDGTVRLDLLRHEPIWKENLEIKVRLPFEEEVISGRPEWESRSNIA